MPQDDKAEEHWHLSKKVPITFIAALIGQTFLVAVFFTDMKRSIEYNGKWIEENKNMKTQMILMRQQLVDVSKLVARLESVLQNRLYPADKGRYSPR